jgi:tRNA U34 5-carboxymethylaminomethyl modifying GTPase MnmE/TrmE
MKELIHLGYIEREKIRDTKGTFRGYEYSIYEESNQSGKSDLGLTDNGKSATTNNNLTNNDLTEYKKEKGILSNDENTSSISFQNQDVIKAMKTYMNDLYRQKTKKKHPFLKPEQYRSVYETIAAHCNEWGTDYDGLIDMMCKFMNTKTIQSDWNINHFATDGIMLNRMYEVAY